jgi:serine/threonine-protein kinase
MDPQVSSGEIASRRLQRLWQQGLPPVIWQFLAEAGSLPLADVAAVLQVDQHECWHRGQGVRAEEYLRAYPALEAEPEQVIELIYREFLLREELGQSPTPAEYLQRFPEYADRLNQQLELHRALDAASRADETRPASPPRPGWPALPGYEILGELGRGGMAVVYKARQIRLDRIVALKVLRAGDGGQAEELARFYREARAVADLRHPHIVQIHDLGEHDGCPFLSLEFIEGGSLAARIAGSPQPARQAARLVETLARAIHHAHEHGIVHRDLKPANILLGGGREEARGAAQRPDPWSGTLVPKIADFGLAKRLAANPGAATEDLPTETGVILGTPSYMAPEQARGTGSSARPEQTAGPVADVYSLGAVLYELLTGRPPFRGETTMATLLQVLEEEPVPPARLQAGLQRDLEIICLKCLRKEPRQRYDSAQALADDLHRFLAGEPIHARPTPRWERAWKYVRRRPAATALVTAAMAVALSLLWGLWGSVNDHLRQRAERAYEGFVAGREKAQFHRLADLLLGQPGAEPDRQAIEDGAREALAAVGVDADRGTGLVLDRYFRDDQKAEIRLSSYELLILLAETAAHGPAGEDGGSRFQTALRLLDQAGALRIETQTYHRRRAEYLAALGMAEDADRERRRAEDPALAGALDDFFAGEADYRRGNLERAQVAFAQTLAAQPNHFPVLFYLALCHLRRQQWAEALATLNACRPLHPDYGWVYLSRGFAYRELGLLQLAEEDFQAAGRRIQDPTARYVLHVHRGALRLRQNRVPEAMGEFTKALELQPDRYQAYVNLAMAHLRLDQLREAEEWYRRALPCQPAAPIQAAYHTERGRSLYRARNYGAALGACQRALELDAGASNACSLQMQIFLEQGRHAEVVGAFSRYMESGGQLSAEIFRGRGLARLHLQELRGAVEDYTRALQLQPDADVYTLRGWAYILKKEWQPAREDFEAALRRNPAHGDARIGRGYARVQLGQYREGIADALTPPVEPTTPEMHFNLACLFAQAAGKAAEDVTAPDRLVLATQLRQHASQAIHAALEKVTPGQRWPVWQEKMLPDEALNPIRGSAEFTRLLEEIENQYARPLKQTAPSPAQHPPE